MKIYSMYPLNAKELTALEEKHCNTKQKKQMEEMKQEIASLRQAVETLQEQMKFLLSKSVSTSTTRSRRSRWRK